MNSSSPLLQARACWVYGQFGSFKFDNADHLRAAIDKIVLHLHSNHIAVRVDAACALSELLDHDEAINFIRPGLEQVLRVFLKIMDEIDFEDLVGALRKIVEVFQDEIAPFAISLCSKLSEAHVRLSSQRRESNDMDDEDNETSLTADGLITAIRRVLNSISGKFPQLYPQLEVILEKSLYVTLQEDSETQTEEGLNCIAELIFNQNSVSERMWGLFNCIVFNYMSDKGIIDENISAASVCIINFMVKSPTEFIGANINGKSPLQMTLEMIQKIFNQGKELEDELTSMCAVTLIMALLENMGEAIQEHLHTINQMYITEAQTASTQDYKNMLIQGLMMNFWYNQQLTISSLASINQLDAVFQFILTNINNMENDFEIKRLIIGLTTLTLTPMSAQLDSSVQQHFESFIKAILFLCQKSLSIREKRQRKIE